MASSIAGVSGVAAPVLAPGGRPVAGVTLAGPTDRVGPQAELLSEAVREAARAIEQALKGHPGLTRGRARSGG